MTDALINLSLEKGYNSVTIRDITLRAGIGYVTFFRHYPDKNSLLHPLIDDAIDNLNEEIMSAAEFGDFDQRGKAIFAYVERNPELCRLLLSPAVREELLGRLALFEARGGSYPPLPSSPHIPPDMARHYAVGAVITLLSWWLNNKRPMSADDMGKYLNRLLYKPIFSNLE